MKLRNKKTGEIGEPRVAYQEIYVDTTEQKTYCYKYIAKLNEEWEDYKPSEPLIKDEKIRKILSDWSKLTQTTKIYISKRRTSIDEPFIALFNPEMYISLDLLGQFDELEDEKEYTIEELCGEEEEPRPVIADGVKYNSYEDYLKSRQEKQ